MKRNYILNKYVYIYLIGLLFFPIDIKADCDIGDECREWPKWERYSCCDDNGCFGCFTDGQCSNSNRVDDKECYHAPKSQGKRDLERQRRWPLEERK